MQESFSFFVKSRNFHHLKVTKCPKLMLLPDAVSSESSIRTFEIRDVGQVELHGEAISVTSLQELNIENSGLVTFHQHALVAAMAQAQSVSVNVINSLKTVIKPKAFAGLRSFRALNVVELVLEHNAFKLKVPTEEPTINLQFVNISSPSLSPNVFPSSFNSITIKNSRIDNVNAKAFSGLFMNNITFDDVSINRINREAFSDNTIIGSLTFFRCNISSLSQKSVISGISHFTLDSSEIQSISKHGAINATVATVTISNNRFRTLGQESFQFISWDTVSINNNTFDFLEEGSLNAIKSPNEDLKSSFTFTDNLIAKANMRSLLTQIPAHVSAHVAGNRLGHACDCKVEQYVRSITGHSALSSPWVALSALLTNTSRCRLAAHEAACWPAAAPWAPLHSYLATLCVPGQQPPACAR